MSKDAGVFQHRHASPKNMVVRKNINLLEKSLIFFVKGNANLITQLGRNW